MKKIQLILIFCISAISEIAISQPMFSIRRSPADSLRDEGNLKGAITEFRKIYAKDSKDQQNVYNFACTLSLDQQADSCFKYLNIAVKLDTSTASLTDPDFLFVREDKRWVDFENKLISMLNVKFKNPYKDIEYAKALWRLKALDQAYFYETGIVMRKLGIKSIVDALWKLKFTINEKNLKELEELIAKRGWPKNSEVGSTAAGAAFFIIQHSNVEKQEKYVPMLREKCEQKEASWLNYAMLYDRMRMNENKPQKYGTQMILNNEETGAEEIYQLEDKSKVDEWRKEIGLPPLIKR